MANESSHHTQKLYSKKKLCCRTYYVLSMNLYQINFVLAITKSATGGVLSEVFLIKVAGLRTATLLKKSLWHSFFPVNFAKFLRAPFYRTSLRDSFCYCILIIRHTAIIPVDTGRKLNVHKTFRRRPGRLLNVL